MRVMGVDPSLPATGFGVIDEKGKSLHAMTYGVAKSSLTMPLAVRLKEIYDQLEAIIAEYEPDIVSVEQLFFAQNVKSALTLGHVRGVVLLAASKAGVEVAEYSPLEIKQAVVGYGRASKEQVRAMLYKLLHLSEVESYDASDALAVALCHIQSSKLKNLLSGYSS